MQHGSELSGGSTVSVELQLFYLLPLLLYFALGLFHQCSHSCKTRDCLLVPEK